ncbi:MAG TPA: hypothetical protein VHO70_17085 [Chitinispirillaceae bacterium]|nr:hypothetical protein [Chitinispirillaceae bacterium]
MKTLSTEVIDQQWKSIETMNLDDVPDFITDLGRSQPYVLTYLMATGEDILNQKEREILLFMGIMVWNITKLCINEPMEILSDKLLDCEKKNVAMLEYLAGEPDTDFIDTVDGIMSKYHQHTLLKYIIDRLMEDYKEEHSAVREENIGMIVIYIKSLIDCLDIYF